MDSGQREVLIRTYEEGPAKLRAAVAEAPEAMRKWRPEAGEFSVHEVAVHCADSETNSHGRIRYLVAEDDATIPATTRTPGRRSSRTTNTRSMRHC